VSLRKTARRGFTLVELMVAMSAGLMVAAAAYTLSKNSLDVFQNESRGFAAQFSGMNGMTRLSADIRRAGFMTSANSKLDPFRCGDMPGGAETRLLSAMVVVRGSSPSYANDSAVTAPDYDTFSSTFTGTDNNRSPDRVRVAGNFATTEMFDLSTYDATDGSTMMLQVDSPAVQRVFEESLSGGPDICDLFSPKDDGGTRRTRFATVTTSAGQTGFVKVSNCVSTNATDGTNYDSVKLTVAFVQSANRCKEAPKTIAPTVLIEYFMAHIDDAADATATGLDASMADLTTPYQSAVTGDDDRMELVRREILADGSVLSGSAEIVSEYVVDLRFAFRALANPPPSVPTLVDFNDTANVDPASGTATHRPERIRSTLIRLSTRSRSPDRAEGVAAVPTFDQPLTRFAVFPSTSTVPTRFSRVRTMTTEVVVPNLAGLVW